MTSQLQAAVAWIRAFWTRCRCAWYCLRFACRALFNCQALFTDRVREVFVSSCGLRYLVPAFMSSLDSLSQPDGNRVTVAEFWSRCPMHAVQIIQVDFLLLILDKHFTATDSSWRWFSAFGTDSTVTSLAAPTLPPFCLSLCPLPPLPWPPPALVLDCSPFPLPFPRMMSLSCLNSARKSALFLLSSAACLSCAGRLLSCTHCLALPHLEH